jgi:O-antigen/teichoic acid export membrane protein
MGRQFLLGVAVQASIYLQSLILFPIVIRHAGAANYGEFVVLVTLLYLVFGLYASGVPYRYRRELVSAQGREERRALFAPQFTFQLICLALVSAALMLWAAASRSGALAAPLIAWLAANTFYRLVADYFRYTLRLRVFNFLAAAFPYLFLSLVLGVVFANGALPVERLLWLQAVSLAVPALLFLPLMLCEIGVPRPNLPWRTLVADFRQGAPLTVELVIDFLLASSDRPLIALFLSTAAVGSYQPAYTLGTLVLFLPKVSDAIVLPNLNKLIDDGKIDEARLLLQIVFNLLLMVALPFVMASLLLGPSILRLLTNDDIAEASRWVTPLVAGAAIFYGVMLLAGQVAFALRRTRAIVTASAFGGVVNVVLNLVLLPVFVSIVVPAVTTLVGYIVGLALIVAMLRRSWRFEVEWPALLRFCVAALAMGLLLLALGYRPGEAAAVGPAMLAGTIAVAAIAYFAVLFVVGGRELRDVRELLGSTASP